jgi:cation:H+ antiporter
MIEHIFILIAAMTVLGFSAHYLVHAAIKIAQRLKVSEAFIGLTIVAAGTSAPEIAVSVVAALNGQGALSVGNVIGSNIFNLGFILGLVAVISPQVIPKKMVYRDGVVLFGSTLIVLAMLWNQFVSFWEGALLLFILASYNLYLWFKKDIPETDEEEMESETKWYDYVVFFVSLFFLIKSADYVVESAVFIAQSFGLSEWAIGATIVAAGTSLPEVATSIIATLKKKFALSVGNVIGSDIFNALGIIGVSAVISPLSVQAGSSMFGLPDNIISMLLLSATILLILFFMRTGWKISRFEGFILLTISISRMAFEIYLGQ